MGFINIIRPDFHLHLRGGAVASWRRQSDRPVVELVAENAEGAGIGMVLVGDASAFAAR